jgi:hypothetical protein
MQTQTKATTDELLTHLQTDCSTTLKCVKACHVAGLQKVADLVVQIVVDVHVFSNFREHLAGMLLNLESALTACLTQSSLCCSAPKKVLFNRQNSIILLQQPA